MRVALIKYNIRLKLKTVGTDCFVGCFGNLLSLWSRLLGKTQHVINDQLVQTRTDTDNGNPTEN
jgi:hypothetical protein